jgi:hypothetical protein
MSKFSFDEAIHAAVYHLEAKLLRLPVIAIQAQYFADGAASWLTFNMDNEVDGFADLSFNVFERRLLVTPRSSMERSSTESPLFGVISQFGKRATCALHTICIRAQSMKGENPIRNGAMVP